MQVIVEVQYQPDDALYGRLFAELFLYLYRATPPRNWQVIVSTPTGASNSSTNAMPRY
ncbi:MAG: DUF2887 domain-containing protein [Gammaproteobacteria bacterium]|nr:DUF2887 domain-containing protein [Gammaproteobacteria bacterium]